MVDFAMTVVDAKHKHTYVTTHLDHKASGPSSFRLTNRLTVSLSVSHTHTHAHTHVHTQTTSDPPFAEVHVAHDHQVVRWRHNARGYELLANPGEVERYRRGEVRDPQSVLAIGTIFYNHVRDEKPDADELAAHLPGLTYEQIVERILREGDIQVTVSEKTAAVQHKREELVEFIHANYVDSGTRAAPTIATVREWLEKAHHKFAIGENVNKDIAVLAEEAVHAILQVGAAAAPKLHKAALSAEVYVPVDLAPRAHGEIKRLATIVGERDEVDRYFYTLALTPGQVEPLKQHLAAFTKGNYGFRLLSVNEEETPAANARRGPESPALGGVSVQDDKVGRREHDKQSNINKLNRAVQNELSDEVKDARELKGQ